MISVIIPVYKSSATLKRTLQSFQLLHGSLQSQLELILVFDGNDTSCGRVVKEWQLETSIINQVLIQDHSGVSLARNNGVKNSRGTFVTFLDDDDEILADRIQAVLDGINCHVLIGKQDLVVSEEIYRTRPEVLSVVAPSEYHIMSMVLKREIFDQIGFFDEDFTVGGDWDFLVRVKKAGLIIDYSDYYFVRRHIHLRNASLDIKEVRKQQFLSLRKSIKKQDKSD